MTVEILWPWDDAPTADPGIPIRRIDDSGGDTWPARIRSSVGMETGASLLVLPAGPGAPELADAAALVREPVSADLLSFLPRQILRPEPVAATPAAWSRIASRLGEKEPHRTLLLLLEATRLGLKTELRHADAESRAADLPPGPVVSSWLSLLQELPSGDRGPLFALALAELLAGIAALHPDLYAPYRFGADPPSGTPLGEPELQVLRAIDEAARNPGRSPSTRALNPALPASLHLGRLVPRVGLAPEHRAALEEILGLREAPHPDPKAPGPIPAETLDLSIVIPSLDGADLLRRCLASIARTMPKEDLRWEVVVVDNASRDDTAAVVDSVPFARRIALSENAGFARPCNLGAAEAEARVLLFLNNDVEVQPGWVTPLLRELESGAAAACALVLSGDGRSVDFAGGGVSFEGKGFQDHFGDTRLDRFGTPQPLLFANGACFAVRRDVWKRTGGFDERFFAYYEDVELGLRLNLQGETIRLVPASRVNHRHNATSRRFAEEQKSFHLERNGLLTVLKIFEAESLRRILPAALLLMVHRGFRRGGPVSEQSDGPDQLQLHVAAAAETLTLLPRIADDRRVVQASREVSDGELIPRMGHFLDYAPTPEQESYRMVQDRIVEAFGVGELAVTASPRTILLVTHEELGENLAGPAIRVVELARALSPHHRVALATPRCHLEIPDVTVREYDRWEERSILAVARDYDVLVVQGHTLQRYPKLRKLGSTLVCDLYCPFVLENLELLRPADIEANLGGFEGDLGSLQTQLWSGDYFLAASEKQRDLWLGALLATGRINPYTYGADPKLDDLIGVVPFGIPDEPPTADPSVVERILPTLAPEDRLLLWGGSLVDWQDPLTVIRAVSRLLTEQPNVKLLFMGVAHPTPGVKSMAVVEQARELAQSQGLLDRQVFFHPWVPYAERGALLRRADLGVLAHRIHAETRYSFRTRILDCIWAELPVVITEGDTFAELVERHELGLTTPPGDPEGFAKAVAALLGDDTALEHSRAQLRQLQDSYRWTRVVEPLLARLGARQRASDRTYLRQRVWRRLLLRYGGGGLLDTARRTLPPSVRRSLKRVLRFGR